jgi:hypothetical protein
VPKEYAAWAHLFEEDLTIKALPKHKLWDYEIIL